jgi:type I restriction enzyme R subunit
LRTSTELAVSAYAGGRRLESTILHALTGKRVDLTKASRDRLETSGGWRWGQADDYDRDFLVDTAQLWDFLSSTQITTDWDREKLDVSPDSPTREAFLTALRWEISYRGIIDVFRRGMSFGPLHLKLMYGLSTPTEPASRRLFRLNRFTVTPRLRFSSRSDAKILNLCLFVNGLPIVTIQLADGTERQNAEEAIHWYRNLNLNEELLFQPGRCLTHFAVDDLNVFYCSDLRELDSVFLPFNKGPRDAEENPASLFGVATDYLWRKILSRRSVVDIMENYAQVVSEKDPASGRDHLVSVFPRYHQLDAVRKLLDNIDYYGVGRRYLIQHSPGSGKLQSMVWLVSQLIDLELVDMAQFGTVVLVTDRPVSDRWLPESIRQFCKTTIVDARQIDPVVIEELMHSPNRIIIIDPTSFSLVLHEIKEHFHGYGYALILDETRSWHEPDDANAEAARASTLEDQVNAAIREWGFLRNASYFVFTSQANDETLELFGLPLNDHGVTRYRPFHQHGL